MDKRYLLLRKRGWYVRYAIPQKVQHYFGKTEFVVSLKTRSLEEAKIRKLRYLESFSNAINSYLCHCNIVIFLITYMARITTPAVVIASTNSYNRAISGKTF